MSRFLTAALAALALACGSSRPAQTGVQSAGAPADPKAPLAKFDGGTVTAGEVDELAKGELRRLETEYQQQTHEVRQRTLDAVLNKRLVERKAKAEGLEADAYVKREVVDKLPQPSEEEMKALYEQAKAAGQPLPSYEEVKPQIVAYLQRERAGDTLKAFYDKLRAEAKVEVLLPVYQPPRVEVSAEGPAKGPEKAAVTIVEFSDYECPYCTRAEDVVQQILKAYDGKVRLVYRDFPLPMHHNAPKAAEAAHCAGDQGKYWEMHAKLFANQRALEVPSLKGYAKELGVDQAKFDKCLDDGAKAKVVSDHRSAGEKLGVTGTPAFFVNGMMISGAQPFENFKALIDAELKHPEMAKK